MHLWWQPNCLSMVATMATGMVDMETAVVDAKTAVDPVDPVDTVEVVDPETAPKVSASIANWHPYYSCMQKVESYTDGRKQRWAHLFPVWAPRIHHSLSCLLQTYRSVVESEESRCYSRFRYDRRLWFLQTIHLCSCQCSSYCHRRSEVGHWFRSVTPHLELSQHVVDVQKNLIIHCNQTRSQLFSHCQGFRLGQQPELPTRSPTYSYFWTFSSIDQPAGLEGAYDYISG